MFSLSFHFLGRRAIFCYSSRSRDDSENGCVPFQGNPFKAFWHHINVTQFKESVFHSPLTTQISDAKQWKSQYQHIKVLAFIGKDFT